MPQLRMSQEILDIIYPIGSVYISVNDSIEPGSLFGGTWERINGRYLLSRDPNTTKPYTHKTSKMNLGAWTLKTKSTVLTINQIPSHNHSMYNINDGGLEGPLLGVKLDGSGKGWWGNWTTGGKGGDQGHDHELPIYPIPSFVVNIWYRTA